MTRTKLRESYDPNWEPPKTSSEFKAKKILEDHGFSVIHNQCLYGYYPDLRIAGTKVLIEIDGGYHSSRNQKTKDAKRTKILESYGFIVLRFTNEQVNKPDLLITKVRAALGIREIKKPQVVAIVADASDLKKMIDKKVKDDAFYLTAKKAAKTAIRQERIGNRKAERNGLKAENAKLRKELKELKAFL
jgi:very-short-patch-repair endonuclease